MKKTNLKSNVQMNVPYNLIKQAITGYWANSVWSIGEYPLPIEGSLPMSIKNLSFEAFSNATLRSIFQFYFYKKLTMHHIGPFTAWTYYSSSIKHIGTFMSEIHPHVDNLLDIPKDKLLLQFQTFLAENSKRPKLPKKYSDCLKQVYIFCEEFFDTREETEKDCWDVRNLGISYNRTKSSFKLHFDITPLSFRPLAKRYIKERLITLQNNFTFSTALHYSYMFNRFFTAIQEKHPDWKDLRDLTREDILHCLQTFRNEKGTRSSRGQQKGTDNVITRTMVYLETFLIDIQRYDWSDAPKRPIIQLIYPEDKPKRKRTRDEDIKHIPDHVWDQTLKHIHMMPPEHIPLIIVMEASGFRISDVLSLKLNCLEQDNQGEWWLRADIMKVAISKHRIPLHADTVAVIQSQIQYIEARSTEFNNPDRYLFPRLRGKRIKEPISEGAVRRALNVLAKKAPILDHGGRVYHFKPHSFRHRYGVTLINNKMPLPIIQQLMAHASPEMTLVYARITDNTLREEWKAAYSKGAVRLSEGGKILKADLGQQAEENGIELEWIRHNFNAIRLDHGICVKAPKAPCGYIDHILDVPCISGNCKSFHVDSTFSAYYESRIKEMEQDMEMYQRTGRTRSMELLKNRLQRFREIHHSITESGGIFGRSKQEREYTKEERLSQWQTNNPT